MITSDIHILIKWKSFSLMCVLISDNVFMFHFIHFYKTTCTWLQCMIYSLNRYLKAPPHNKTFDIIRVSYFSKSSENFKAAVAELKRMGLGDIEHDPSIEEPDRRNMYTSMYLYPTTPVGLQNKVQFDIRLYFCRRGMENIAGMTKITFEVKTNHKSGLKFVTKAKDELTKYHRGNDKEKTSGIMPENPGSEYCPVLSVEKYISKLHPSCDKLWKRSHDDFDESDATWYCNVLLGERTLL